MNLKVKELRVNELRVDELRVKVLDLSLGHILFVEAHNHAPMII